MARNGGSLCGAAETWLSRGGAAWSRRWIALFASRAHAALCSTRKAGIARDGKRAAATWRSARQSDITYRGIALAAAAYRASRRGIAEWRAKQQHAKQNALSSLLKSGVGNHNISRTPGACVCVGMAENGGHGNNSGGGAAWRSEHGALVAKSKRLAANCVITRKTAPRCASRAWAGGERYNDGWRRDRQRALGAVTQKRCTTASSRIARRAPLRRA